MVYELFLAFRCNRPSSIKYLLHPCYCYLGTTLFAKTVVSVTARLHITCVVSVVVRLHIICVVSVMVRLHIICVVSVMVKLPITCVVFGMVRVPIISVMSGMVLVWLTIKFCCVWHTQVAHHMSGVWHGNVNY